MDILIHIGLIVVMTGLYFLLRFSENPFIYASVLVLSLVGLIISITTGVYITDGDTQEFSYISTCGNSSANQCLDTITTTPNKIDLGAWGFVFNLSYLAYFIGSIVFWAYSNRREEEY